MNPLAEMAAPKAPTRGQLSSLYGDLGVKATKKTEYEFRSDVFVLHRPARDCEECGAQPSLSACKHVRAEEYVALRNKMLTDGSVEVSCARKVLEDGTAVVALEWLVPKTGPAAKVAKRKGPDRL